MLWYGVITVSAVMFGAQFWFTQMFRRAYGSGIQAVLVSSAGTALVGIAALSIINGFQFACTPFSLLMALLVTINGLLFSLCSLNALGHINLSLYSVFSMLGGMALPFAAGILFYDEALTPGRIVSFILITASLFLTVQKGDKRTGTLWYAGIFVLNGMSGVLSKIFQAAPYAKVSASEYSILCAAVTLVVSLAALAFCREKLKPLNRQTVISLLGSGVLNRVANYLLLLSLAYLPASAQYPFITGGTMIFSTLLCYFTPQKPSKRELAALAVSLVGVLLQVFLP